MMNETMEVVFIIDRSGSMAGLERDTVGGINRVLAEQKKIDGRVLVSTVFFNHEVQPVYDRADLSTVAPLTLADFVPMGSTALLDAVGLTVTKILAARKAEGYAARKVEDHTAREAEDHTAREAEDHVTGEVEGHTARGQLLFAIMTDGEENSSTLYSTREVKTLIELAETGQGANFIFLGANIDSWSLAEKIGLKRQHVADYTADDAGTDDAYRMMGRAMEMVRTCGEVSGEWKDKASTEKR